MSESHRRLYIDWARGIAVLLMIEAHTFDAWTRVADKPSKAYGYAAVLGGFAAPLFLWLAGLGVVLAAARGARGRGGVGEIERVCRRGVEIFLLAFLFRLQAFILSPGSYPVTLFRVDILNIMGPSMAAAGVLWIAAKRPWARVAVFGAAAVAIGMATPIIRSAAFVDRLPIWFQWYLRPSFDHTTFTLFPWSGFVFAGAAIGALVAAPREDAAERRLHLSIAASGVALIAFGLWAAGRPSIYAAASFWTSSPTWFAIRVGILTVAFAACFAIERVTREAADTPGLSGPARAVAVSWQRPLARMGRASLFIYWIHVELVYGYASWLWRHRMPIPVTLLAFAAFVALMYAAVIWRDRLVGDWRRITPAASSGPFVRNQEAS